MRSGAPKGPYSCQKALLLEQGVDALEAVDDDHAMGAGFAGKAGGVVFAKFQVLQERHELVVGVGLRRTRVQPPRIGKKDDFEMGLHAFGGGLRGNAKIPNHLRHAPLRAPGTSRQDLLIDIKSATSEAIEAVIKPVP